MGVFTRLLLSIGACFAVSGPLAAEPFRIGEVEFNAPDEVWDISESTPATSALLKCLSPSCHRTGQIILLSVHSPSEHCSPEDFGDGETTSTLVPADAPNGLDFVLFETYLGCRNYVPPQVNACAILNDRSYRLSTITPQGCQSSFREIPRDLIIEILKSARIAS